MAIAKTETTATAKKRRKVSRAGATKGAPSDDTLAQLPKRVVTFLAGVGTIPEVRAALVTRGYSDTVHQTGWTLLELVGGRASFAPPPAPPEEVVDEQVTAVPAAMATIQAWATTNFAIASAALKHTHPAQHRAVFGDGLKAAPGASAVLATKTFLTRVERLGTKRRGAHPDDARALELLGERGITEAERARIGKLIEVVQEGKKPVAPAVTTPSTSTREAQLKLYAWFNEWTGITHAVVKRRDHLVRLGLASLKRKAKTA